MTRKMMVMCVVIILGGMGLIGLNANENMHYGYISYLDGNATIIRLDGSQNNGTINLPLVPGDKIITGEKDRCEIQFDNGTVMRLDKNTVLRIETILAEALTTSRKLTTLYLDQGEIYSLVKNYKRENFQVITPNAAVLLKKNSLNTIAYDEEQGTYVYAERGSVKVLFGNHARKVKQETVKRKKGFRITPSHKFVRGIKRDLEFVFWNEKINKNYKELHFGVSRVPKPIYKYSKGIVEFAEKWSTMYGEWMYDDIFGYVWRPYEKQFAWSKRPFLHAQHVNINGQLFLVPSQRWGWAPAHLGTWVWMNKKGWVWIPGDAFSPGAQRDMFDLFYSQLYMNPHLYFYWMRTGCGYPGFYGYSNLNFNTMDDWLNYLYGSDDGYTIYRRDPQKYMATRVSETAPGIKRKKALKDAPQHIRRIIKRMNKTPLSVVEKKLFGRKGNSDFKIMQPRVRPMVRSVSTPAVRSIAKAATLRGRVRENRSAGFRTWCPDKRWARVNHIKVEYSSRTNAVICRELGFDSNHLNSRVRVALRHGNATRWVGTGGPGGRGNMGYMAGSYSASASSSSSVSAGTATSRTSSGGSKGGKEK